MKHWKDFTLHPDEPIHKAIKLIDSGEKQIALVADDAGHLVGTITDGDVRRGILRNLSLDSSVDNIMNTSPIILPDGATIEEMRDTMQIHGIKQIILVKEGNYIHEVITLDECLSPKLQPYKVVLMAGGMGTRLRPLTENCPKPLIEVGGQPILEILLRNFSRQGFRDIILSVNYKSEMIKEFCGDGRKFGVLASYIEEDKRLGTAGALSLLKESFTKEPFLVMNADLLTQINFKQMIDFHIENNSAATMAVRKYSFEVPYGVVQLEGIKFQGIVEKPQQNFFINAGIYVLNPDVIKLIPKNEFFDMPQLFDLLAKKNSPMSVFPIREYWIDIGRVTELEAANSDYEKLFNNSNMKDPTHG